MKTFLAFFIGMLSLAAVAQGTYKCDDNYKVFEGRFLAKEYEEAYKVMNELRVKCPKVDENLYLNGEIVLKYLVEVAPPEEQKSFINDLVALYNEQSVNFPDSGAGVKKTQLQLDSKLITQTEAYKAYNSLFDKHRAAFDDYNSLYTYFGMVQEDYNKKGLTEDQYFEKYALISSQVSAARNKIAEKKAAIVKKQETTTLTDIEKEYVRESVGMMDALENVEHIIQKQSRSIVSCEKLEEYYSKNYESHKADLVWIESMTDALQGKKCHKSGMLLKGAQALHQAKPSKDTAYRLGTLALRKADKKEAVDYFEQAASFEANPVKKSDIYYEVANALQNTDKEAAKKYILKSAQLNPKEAKGYLLLAEMYATVPANDDCKLNDFDRKALNYLSLEALKKAEAAADAKYKTAIASSKAKYEKNLPTKEMAKAVKKGKGDKITYGCWINETVTLPKL